MNREALTWTIILGIGLALILFRCAVWGVPGKAYVEAKPHEFVNVTPQGENDNWASREQIEAISSVWILGGGAIPGDREVDLSRFPEEDRLSWTVYEQAEYADYMRAEAKDPAQTAFSFSLSRTIGIWLGAFFTLAILSFLYRDNPFYKTAEATFIGVSAAYWMVVAFWTVLVPNLFGKLMPFVIKAWAMPGLEGDKPGSDPERDLMYLVPLVLGIMLLWRLAPVAGWISRWPLAFIIGVFCGLRLIGFFQGDFLNQIRNGIAPLYVDGGDWWSTLWASVENIILVFGVLACLVYFFFSVEHKGAVGKTARVGIWVLMITFGAGFGYTVMGRIALLAIRIEFLVDDWLWLIDPTGKRAVETVAMLMGG